MGHEVIGRWLQEEVGKDSAKLERVERLLESAYSLPHKEHILVGKEITLSICGDEVTVEENVLKQELDYQGEEAFSPYNSESTASCGIEDFDSMIKGWREFVFG